MFFPIIVYVESNGNQMWYKSKKKFSNLTRKYEIKYLNSI